MLATVRKASAQVLSIFLVSALVIALAYSLYPQKAHGVTAPFWTVHSPGYYVHLLDHNSDINISGTSQSPWAGGQATTVHQLARRGTMNVQLVGNLGADCQKHPGVCPYGKGEYRATQYIWFDAANWYEIGILDEGYVTWGPQFVVRGTNKGQPFQYLYPLVTFEQLVNNASIIRKVNSGEHIDIDQSHLVRDFRHIIKTQWSSSQIFFMVDNYRKYGPFRFTAPMYGPAAQLVAAAKKPGDMVNVLFHNVDFAGKVPTREVFIPEGKPYASVNADVMSNGMGVGFNAYIRLHDSNGSAAAAGIQTDCNAYETNGSPHLFLGRVEDGIFDYDYALASDWNWHNLRIEWWKDSKWAVIWYDGRPVASMKADLRGRLYATLEGDASRDGDSVHAYFKNVKVQIGNPGAGDCGFFELWQPYSSYGIQQKQTGSDSFEIWGTARGVPAGKDWDLTLITGALLTFQYQPENKHGDVGCMVDTWSNDPAHGIQ